MCLFPWQHCLFVNNCVGAHNYKFFVLLLLYTVLGGGYNAAISYYCLSRKQRRGTNVLDFSSGMVMANACTIGVIALILFPFVSYHIYLATTNTTTLEALRGKTSSYDLGSPVRNLKHVSSNKHLPQTDVPLVFKPAACATSVTRPCCLRLGFDSRRACAGVWEQPLGLAVSVP